MKHNTRNLPWALALALLAVGCPGSKNSSSSEPTTLPCESTADCQESEESVGYLCIEGVCQPCQSTSECTGTPFYGDGSVCDEGRCTLLAGGGAGGRESGTGGRPNLGGTAGAEPSTGGDSNVGGAAGGEPGTAGQPQGGSSAAGAGNLGGEATGVAGTAVAGRSGAEAGTSAAGSSGAAVGGAGQAGSAGQPGSVGGSAGTAPNGGTGGVVTAGGAAGEAGDGGAGGELVADCPDGSALLPSGECVSCGDLDCTGQGETGHIYPYTLANGVCICETEEGYYHPAGEAFGTYPCDADGDGWVRDTVAQILETPTADPVLVDNARCAVRAVAAVVFENEAGQESWLYLTADFDLSTDPAQQRGGLPLYESVRNDEQSTLDLESDSYGTRGFNANELNSLTKACVSESGDHNHNGIADVNEWSRAPGDQSASAITGVGREDYLPLYAHLSYFVELYTGHFEDSAVGPGGDTVQGVYRIQERQRLGGDLPVLAGSTQTDYWQSCERERDAEHDAYSTSVTMDFAWVSSNSEHGLNHHSQFKCVQAVSGVPDPSQLQRQSEDTLATLGWTVNRCGLGGSTAPATGRAVNPSVPVVACAVETGSVAADEVVWVETGYTDYPASEPERYVRGCVNGCVEVLPNIGECEDCTPESDGQAVATDLPRSTACGDNDTMVCDGAGNCGDCVPGLRRCSGAELQFCSDYRAWETEAVCYECVPDSLTCYPECSPPSSTCLNGVPQVCDSNGLWQGLAACASDSECVGGQCLKSDGESCEGDTQCASGVCTTFYVDADGDGYTVSPASLCGTSPPSGRVLSSLGTDCCDSDINAYPGQTTMFVASNNCGSYDYNCDDVITQGPIQGTSDCGNPISCGPFCGGSPNCQSCIAGACGPGSVRWIYGSSEGCMSASRLCN